MPKYIPVCNIFNYKHAQTYTPIYMYISIYI